MPQFVLNSDDDKNLERILLDGWYSSAMTEIRKFKTNLYASQNLGYAIYDAGVLGGLTGVVDREFFSLVYPSFFQALKKAGTAEGYISFFRTLFGNETEVTFDYTKPPGVLFCLVRTDLGIYNWVDESSNQIVDEVPNKLVFATIFDGKTIQQTEAILEFLIPSGIYSEFTIEQI